MPSRLSIPVARLTTYDVQLCCGCWHKLSRAQYRSPTRVTRCKNRTHGYVHAIQGMTYTYRVRCITCGYTRHVLTEELATRAAYNHSMRKHSEPNDSRHVAITKERLENLIPQVKIESYCHCKQDDSPPPF